MTLAAIVRTDVQAPSAPPQARHPGRVLIIVENLPVPFDRRVWSEATTLRRAGHEVSVICPFGQDATAAHEVIDGIHIYRHPLPLEAKGKLGYLLEYASALFWEFRLSLRVRRERGFDVIQACNPPDLIVLVAAVHRLLFGTRFIFDHHDLNPELFEAKFGKRGPFWHLLVLMEKLTFAMADLSIATNESYKAIAVSRGGMDPDKVAVVRSGPNLALVRKLPSDPAWRNGRKHLVGYVGVIGRQEGIDLLLESVRHIVVTKGRSDIQFAIMGSGPEWETVKAQSEAMGLTNFVTFAGRVDDHTLMTVLSTADVCVNPDRPCVMNDKSTMNKILEYMALGKPIVQYDLTEGRVSAGIASLYARNTDTADFGELIMALIDDPALRERMGEFGERRVREVLSWPHEAPKLVAAYDRVLAPRKQG